MPSLSNGILRMLIVWENCFYFVPNFAIMSEKEQNHVHESGEESGSRIQKGVIRFRRKFSVGIKTFYVFIYILMIFSHEDCLTN